MGLRDEIKKIIAKFFKTKRLTSVSEIEEIDVNDMVDWKKGISEFDRSLKVDVVPELQGNRFSEIKDDVKKEIMLNVENFKGKVLNSDEIQKIQSDEARSGESNGQPFICIAEMDADGKIQTTIIVTPNACSKTTIDENGNTIYQESRMVNGRMKTIISDNKDSSLALHGNFTQEEIDRIKKFSDDNGKKINNIKQFKTEEEKDAYLALLSSKTSYEEGNDFSDENKYLLSCSGRSVKENGGKVLKEIYFALDKNNLDENPLVITLNSLKEGKLKRERFRLTEEGKYIDENSFRLNDKGEPEYTEITFEQLKEYAVSQGFNIDYIDQVRNHKKEEKALIPPGAINIHKALQAELTREASKPGIEMPSMDDQIK